MLGISPHVHSPLGPSRPALRRTQSSPALDAFEAPRPGPSRPLCAQLLAAAQAVVKDVQREPSEEDRKQARLRPCVEASKKCDDYGSLGITAFHRRIERNKLAGNSLGVTLNAAGFLMAEMAGVVSLGSLNLLAWGGRHAYERVAGARFLKPRSDGGVREDMIMRALKAWQEALKGEQAQRLRQEAAGDPKLTEVMAAVTRADEAVRSYVKEHPDARVRNSVPLDEALRASREVADRFNRRVL